MAKEIMTTKLGKDGRIVLPVKVRRALGLKAGGLMNVTLGENKITLRSQAATLEELREKFRDIWWKPGQKMASEELIEERRAEAKREFGS